MPRILVNIFAVFGVIALIVLAAWAGMIFFVDSGSDIKVEQSLPSPDQKNIATLYTGMGGGAAGWCSMYVAINSSSTPFSPSVENSSPKDRVYMGSCSIKPKLNWVSPTVLQITLPDFINKEWSSASVKGTNESGSVVVQFVFTHNKSFKVDGVPPPP